MAQNNVKKIGILSDTHGLLRPEVLNVLQGCDYIFHAGDINRQSILDELEKIAPVSVVRGNNDKEWADRLPESITTEIENIRIYMIHNKKFLPKNPGSINLVIYGHSHKYEDKEVNGIRYLNPGSCGPRRFHQEISLATLSIKKDGSYQIDKILIEHHDKKMQDDSVTADIIEKMASIIKDIEAGKTVKQIAKKYGISEDLADSIVRMYLTHPGIDVDGILRRIGL